MLTYTDGTVRANESLPEMESFENLFEAETISLLIIGLASVITNSTFLALLRKMDNRKSFFFLQGFRLTGF
ncbi:hypothetical protein M514_04871 [Trichuris suis]|uniref:Uncharacterized protein n=1 Tax=Trichuris suis TaxID=68888 RepID=A0A085NUG6_9BILA|nr:hypothetical protein M513_04871 [Trichuris suis]KFD73112.1 hypothetical protein M514_04871 [Trichuris suis]